MSKAISEVLNKWGISEEQCAEIIEFVASNTGATVYIPQSWFGFAAHSSKTWTYEELTAIAEKEINYWRLRAGKGRNDYESIAFLPIAGILYANWCHTCSGYIKTTDQERLAALAKVEI